MEIAFVVIAALLVALPLFFMTRMASGMEHVVRLIGYWSRQTFRSYCNLETLIDDHVLVGKNGSLISYIKLSGSFDIVGDHEFGRVIQELNGAMQSMMSSEGHLMQVVYSQDSAGETVKKTLAPSRATARRIGLDIEDLIDDDERILAANITSEKCWLVLTTLPSALPESIIKDFSDEFIKEKARVAYPSVGMAQNPALAFMCLKDKHDSALSSLRDKLSSARLRHELLSGHQALNDLRSEIDPSTHYAWRPSLPGDKIHPDVRFASMNPEDMLYPPLWMQLAPSDVKTVPGHQEKLLVGGRFFGSVTMEIPQQDPTHFHALLRLIRDIPCRFSFRVHPNGLDMAKLNSILVGFLAIFPKSMNRRIKNALDYLEKTSKINPVVGVAVQATTWADDEKTLNRQMQELSSKMQGWGVTDTSQRCGDAVASFASGLPGFGAETASKAMLMDSQDMLEMMPFIGRPASAWDAGAANFVSPDGKLMPFQPGSSKQNTWVYLLFAPPGSGKSVLLLSLEYACCVAPGLKRLPLMTVIDVGESVSGLISLLQSSLPASRQHEAGYFKMQLNPEYAVNVLDTQLGFRFPQPQERDLSLSFMSMLATPAGRTAPYDSVYELMGLVLDEMYMKFSDKHHPKRYEAGILPHIDDCLSRSNIKIDVSTSWWEVTDALYLAGFANEAGIAQRYAMPLISDASVVLNSPRISDIYGKVTVGDTGESLIDLCSRMISASLGDFKIFGRPTQWDLSNCRVVGLDLNDVRGTGESGKKQTALMYTFAQNVSSKNYYLHADMLRLIPHQCPEIYRDFHKGRIDDVAEEIKTVVYDEFHNTGGLDGIRRVVGLNIREGRKWGIQVMLASQLVDDFDASMRENATSVFILSASNPVTNKKCQDAFALSESTMTAMENYIRGPGTFMVRHTTKEGVFSQVMRNLLSPIKYWAFTTTLEDKQIRRKLYEVMPASEARKLLAGRFPRDGMFKSFIEQRRRQMVGDDDGNVIEQVATELKAEYDAEISGG